MEPHQKSNYGDDEDEESQNRQSRIRQQSREAARIVRQFLSASEFRKQDLANLGKNY